MMNLRKTYAGLAVGLAFGTSQAFAVTAVDVELSLLVDTSGSVSDSEFVLQRNGYGNAFQSPAIAAAIAAGAIGKIAVNLVYWSSAGQQTESIGFTEVTAATAAAFGAAINATARPFNGLTAPGSAIAFAHPLLFSNDFDGTIQVIDVSGDGEENDGLNTATARDAALAAGVERINGLAIGSAALEAWYNANIKGGVNAFVIRVDDFADFEGAVLKKLEAEIRNNPKPGPAPGPGFAAILATLGGLLAFRTRRA
jgi:hypothetical protein